MQRLTPPSTLRCAGRLPEEALDLCEVEPLRQEDPDSTVWVPDELQVFFQSSVGSTLSVDLRHVLLSMSGRTAEQAQAGL